jgi:hypothetical protein
MIKKEFIYNAVQCNAMYSGDLAEDVWTFPGVRDNGLNPLLLRCASKDELVKPNLYVIFELVIYVRQPSDKNKVVEMSCGWCQMELNDAEQFGRAVVKKLPIKGGSPSAEMLIKDSDVHKNRTGIKYSIMGLVSNKIDSQLTVAIRPFSKFSDDNKFHMDMLPTVCLLPKRLLFLVSGFRNYLGEKLLSKQSGGGLVTFKKPEGDPVVTTF